VAHQSADLPTGRPSALPLPATQHRQRPTASLRHPAWSTGSGHRPAFRWSWFTSVCCIWRLHRYWTGLTPGTRSQPNQWARISWARRWGEAQAAQPIDDGRQGRHRGRPITATIVQQHNRARPDPGQHPLNQLVGGEAGPPVGRVDAPQHGAVADRLAGRRHGRGGGPPGGRKPTGRTPSACGLRRPRAISSRMRATGSRSNGWEWLQEWLPNAIPAASSRRTSSG
jgi:hypothetical protein